MAPCELWWMIEAKQPVKMHGSLSESDVEDLHAELTEMGYLNG